MAYNAPRARVAHIRDHVEVGCPVRERRLPRRDGRQRNDNEERTELTHAVEQVAEIHYALHRLAQTHLVREDTILTTVPEVGEPVQPSQLEVFELVRGDRYKVWVADNLGERRTTCRRIVLGTGGEESALLAILVGLDLLAGDDGNFVCFFPGGLFVVEAVPFAEVLGDALFDLFGDDAFDRLVGLTVLEDTFTLDGHLLLVFERDERTVEVCEPVLVLCDVVLDALETATLLEELVELVRVVEVRVVFPLDVEPNVVGPDVLWVVHAVLIPLVLDDDFNLVLFGTVCGHDGHIDLLRVGDDIVVVKAKVFALFLVVGDLAAARGDTEVGLAGTLLALLAGTGAVLGVAV